jgi:Uma2 family endonuclease
MRMPTLKRRWTVDDLQDLPDDGQRYEVIDGELFVTPAPSLPHQRAVLDLARILADYVRAESIGDLIIAPADVRFSDVRSVQPDLFVMPLVDGRRPRRFEEVGRLLLAVEVPSPSTARADRVDKRVLFRDEGVAEYWIVDLDARTIERSTPADPRVDVLVDHVEWRPEGAASSITVDLPDYFARVLDDQ